jgi:hypothetical protein
MDVVHNLISPWRKPRPTSPAGAGWPCCFWHLTRPAAANRWFTGRAGLGSCLALRAGPPCFSPFVDAYKMALIRFPDRFADAGKMIEYLAATAFA